MLRKRVEELLSEVRKVVGVKDDSIHVVLYPMKHKIASVSFGSKTIRLNKYVVQELDDEALKYILVHELVHYKTRSIQHNRKFWKELGKLYSKEEVIKIESRIINSIYVKFKHPL